MSKLNIFDIVALAKAGYKAQDIEKLTSIDIPDDVKEKDEESEKDEEKGKEKPAAGSQPPAENGAKETLKDKEGDPEKEKPDIDYKKLYEEKCAELENVQKKNTRTEQPEVKTTSLDDIVRSFM